MACGAGNQRDGGWDAPPDFSQHADAADAMGGGVGQFAGTDASAGAGGMDGRRAAADEGGSIPTNSDDAACCAVEADGPSLADS